MSLLKKNDPTLADRLHQAQVDKGVAVVEFEAAADRLVGSRDALLDVAAQARAEADELAALAAHAEYEAEHSDRVAGRLRDLLA